MLVLGALVPGVELLLFGRPEFGDLAAVPLSDFRPEVDLWLLQSRAPGMLQAPIERFGAHVRAGFATAHAPRVTRARRAA